MNRSDLERSLTNSGVVNSTEVMNALLEIIELALAVGEPVSIRNFGRLEPVDRAPMVRKNPRTGQEVKVGTRRTVVFRPSPALRDRVNKSR